MSFWYIQYITISKRIFTIFYMYKHVNRQTLIYNLFTIIKSLWKNGTELNIVSVTIGYVSLLHLRFQVHQKLCLDLIFFLNKRKVFYLGVMSRHLITGNTSSALIFRNSTVFGLIFLYYGI